MAGQIYRTQRPPQEHINLMIQRSKEVHFKQMEILEMNGDFVGGDIFHINLETQKQKKKRQTKQKKPKFL